MIAYAVYSLSNGQWAVVVAGQDYQVFDTQAQARAYLDSLQAVNPRPAGKAAPAVLDPQKPLVVGRDSDVGLRHDLPES